MRRMKVRSLFLCLNPGNLTPFKDAVLIDLPTQRPESYAFSVPLTSIYSLLVHPPTLSSWRTFSCCLWTLTRLS